MKRQDEGGCEALLRYSGDLAVAVVTLERMTDRPEVERHLEPVRGDVTQHLHGLVSLPARVAEVVVGRMSGQRLNVGGHGLLPGTPGRDLFAPMTPKIKNPTVVRWGATRLKRAYLTAGTRKIAVIMAINERIKLREVISIHNVSRFRTAVKYLCTRFKICA